MSIKRGIILKEVTNVVDHCVFLNCHASAVFWDGFNGTVGKGNAMRYCIIYGGHIAGVWAGQDIDLTSLKTRLKMRLNDC